jgi:hypothetical protein
MDEAAEQVAAGYPKSLRRRVRTDGWANARVGRLEVERAVGSLLVVVPDVDAEDMLELAAAEDQEPVEAFAADAADPAFHVGVGVWRPDGRADDLDVLTRQEGVEGARELRVAVVDQEAHRLVVVVKLHHKVARLLQHPGGVGLAGAGEVLNSAASDREEDEHVEAAQPDRVDSEEVAGEDRVGMRLQEAAPRLRVARGRRNPEVARMLRTEVAETAMPSLRSSPAIRR